MGLVVWYTSGALEGALGTGRLTARLAAVGGSIALGVAVFSGLAVLLRVDELRDVFSRKK